MNLKKAILAVAVTGIVALSVAGCGSNTETTTAAQQFTPTITPTAPGIQTPPSTNGVRLAPSADNGTMPAPPQGGVQGQRPAMPEIDYAAAAAKLGVTEEQLKAALGELEQGPFDIAAAAEKLGVTGDTLREALGLPSGGQPQGGPPPDGAAPTAQGNQAN
jgi:hypothetical protein